MVNDAGDEVEDARLVCIVDLVGSVGRLVIVLVRAGPEEEDGNLLGVE